MVGLVTSRKVGLHAKRGSRRAGARLALIFAFALSCLPGALGAQTAKAGPAILASEGLESRYGSAYSYVYEGAQGDTLSELVWDLKPILGLRSRIELRYGDFDFMVSAFLGLPGNSGVVEDSDWQNLSLGDTTTKTNFSRSPVRSEHLIDTEAMAGWSFRVLPGLALHPSLAVRLVDLAWSAADGTLQYADNIGNATPPYHPYTTGSIDPLYGLLSTYSQSYTLVVFGLSIIWQPTPGLWFEPVILMSPFLGAKAIDHHILRSLIFTDTFKEGLVIEPGLAATWQAGGGFLLRGRAGFTWIDCPLGDETVFGSTGVDPVAEGINPGQKESYAATVGAALHSASLGLELVLKLR